jgi:hypothetical protein
MQVKITIEYESNDDLLATPLWREVNAMFLAEGPVSVEAIEKLQE